MKHLSAIDEIDQTDTQTIVARVAGRVIRVTAVYDLRASNFHARYYERGEAALDGRIYEIWHPLDYPDAYGTSISDCLRMALGFVSVTK